MSAKSSIQVCIKVRPCEAGNASVWEVKESRSIRLIDNQADPCVFDYVFDQNGNNQEVFDRMAKHIVHACMQGFNGTIFAYGQTSSGKTYTMMGDRENPGVMVLAAKEIFKQIANDNDREYLLRVGYIEIYNEKVYDLLNKKNQDLKIHEAGNGIVNVNCEECIITSESDLLRFLSMGNKERTVGETNMNERSSRSHAIFRIIIESRKSDRTVDDAVIQSVLNLVDLAGSERAGQTGASGTRLKEGSHINKSLLFLSNVIMNLSENLDNKFISFRDSKLTRILQASLGGNAFTSIICTIKPSIVEESLSTINFAMRAKKIRIKPEVNEMVSDATMMKRLEREIKELKDRLAEEQRKNESQLKVKQLENRIQNDMLKIITSNSLNDKRFKNRRRTWCPATSIPESAIPTPLHCGPPEPKQDHRQSKLSHLPKPVFFPNSHISHRADNGPKTINIMKSLDIGTSEEEFSPAELIDFGLRPSDVLRTKELSRAELSLTPNVGVSSLVEKTKIDRLELQMFTSLEKQFEGDWEKSQALAEKLSEVTAQRDELESESQKNAQRCEALQAEVEAVNAKNTEYEEQLKALKETIQKLEVENREAVSLEFEYQSHKTKSKLRETDLLSALSEKDLAIENLQKTLDEISRDVLRNSKEELMRSICPELESSPERICTKCLEFESLLADADTKLKNVQVAFTQKTEDCERLNTQISTAHGDMAILQGKNDSLEQNLQSQQQAIEAMEADYNLLQQKYQQLQQEYEDLRRTSSASEEQVLLLESDNTRLQAEIVTLRERVEEAQRLLLEAPSPETLAEQFKAQSDQLKAELANVQTSLAEMQEEYNCMSNQLMDSVEECDVLQNEVSALREELKLQKSMPSCDIESMKSSGVGTECSDLDSDADSGFLEKFARLSDSLHEIELQHRSGSSRLFRATKIHEQNVPGLKLCLESATDIHTVSHPLDDNTADEVCLKGVLRQHRFQIIRLTQESAPGEEEVEKRRLLDHIARLEMEIAEKNMLIDVTEGTINEMREQMTDLESALLEKSVIVNKVESYQRQIESLEKQNAEITIVCEELQEKVKENTLSESLMLSHGDDTLPGSTSPLLLPDQEASEIAALKTSLSELKDKVAELQGRVEIQLLQLQQKDNHIDQLRTEIDELNERCMSMEVKQVELQSNASQKQQLLERQAEKLADDVQRIDQLQETNAKLVERSTKAEESLSEMQERLLQNNGDIQTVEEDLKSARDRIETLQEDLKSARDRIETLQEDLKSAGDHTKTVEEDLKSAGDRIETLEEDLKTARDSIEAIEQTKIDELNALKLEYLDKIEQSENEYRANFRKYNAEWEEGKERYEQNVASLVADQAKAAAQHQAELEDIRIEHNLVLDQLRQEKLELESLCAKSQELVEELQSQMNAHDRSSSVQLDELIAVEKQRNQELKDRCEEHILDYEQQISKIQADLDKLKEEKMALHSEIKEAESQHASTLEKIQLMERELETLSKQTAFEKAELLDKLETFSSKNSDLNEELQRAQKKALSFEDLLSQHQRLQECLSEATGVNITLREQVENLQCEINSSQKEQSDRTVEIETLRSELISAFEVMDSATAQESLLKLQMQLMETKISSQAAYFQQEVAVLKSSKNELQLKLESLQESKTKLESCSQDLEVAMKNARNLQSMLEEEQQMCCSLRDAYSKLEESNDQLVGQLKEKDAACEAFQDSLSRQNMALEEANVKCLEMRQEVKEARMSVEELKNECETLRSSLNAALAQQEQVLAESDKQCLELRQKSRQLVAQLQEKEAVCETLQDSLSQQTQALEEANKKCVEMRQEAEEARQSVAELTKECESLQTALKTTETERDSLRNSAAQQEQILAETDKKCLELQQEIKESLQLVAQLKEKDALSQTFQGSLSQQTQALQEANGKCLEMRQELEEARQSVAALTKECQKLQTAMDTIEAERDSLRISAAQQEQTLAETNKKCLEMRQELEEARQSVAALTKECESLQTALKTIEAERDSLRNAAAQQEQIIAETDKKCLELQQEIKESLQLVAQLKEKDALCQTFQGSLSQQTQALEEANGKCLEMRQELEEARQSVAALTKECESLQTALKTTETERDSLRNSAAQQEQILAETDKKCLELQQEIKESLQLVAQLKEKDALCQTFQGSLSQQTQALQEANGKCLEMRQELEEARQSVAALTKECQKLQTAMDTIEAERDSLRISAAQQEQTLAETNKKCLEMRQEVEEARQSVAQVKEKDAAWDALQNSLSQQKLALEVAKQKCLEMHQKDEQSRKSVATLTKECETLRTTMKTNETDYRTEMERVQATASSLLEDKRNLEEKVCTLNDIVEKLQGDLTTLQGLKANASNVSFESNASSTSPSAPRKSISFESDWRKNRRLSVHDERRRQSYWNNVRDWGTMTDPVDNNCNCVELNQKLQDCQRDLFIRESQVTALNIELKNHPLKDENAQLQKRLLEEQEKARAELRRLKLKNQDLTIKVNDMTAAASASVQGQACRITPAMISVDTQTESDLEKVLEKTNLKYQDALKLCRFRYSTIQDLEQRLKQNENCDTSNLTSLTAGQINALKTQCEAHKKEISAMNEKYEYAKRVLKMRKDEVVELRAKIADYEAASTAK
ncbi:kinesin-related protein 4 isoform X1 [Drosophila pseudoobscura]|uniref:Kinesin-related protein 4 isoform X1 n=1 Tax=Drosophila pseudoobscura pseudoobscura TaxID=46245 RepID=A0A6I8UXL5_DROPS|nr:kinesin-related protein 4 isoform X1 [Drosophila pseudoobscura]